MKVKDHMSTNVITIPLDASLNEGHRVMKENNIRRLPVMEKDRLVGIITLSDLNRAAPSSATLLSVHELNYLLAKTKIKDILPKKQNLLVTDPESYIETAAKLMRLHKISGLPVMQAGKLVGIITETDLFDALIDILEVTKPHSRIDINCKEQVGSLAQICQIIAQHGVSILNLVVYYAEKTENYKLIVRIETLDSDPIIQELKAQGHDVQSVLLVKEV